MLTSSLRSQWRLASIFLPLLAAAAPARAQVQAVTPLEFFGFRSGASLTEVSAQLDQVHGGRLGCDRARLDPSVSECRAAFSDPVSHRPLALWLSAMDSVAGIVMVSGSLSLEQLGAWKGALLENYGEVGVQVQGPQWMMQWVRHGRMLRLTWRVDGGEQQASVSLVDGHILDAWAARGRGAQRH